LKIETAGCSRASNKAQALPVPLRWKYLLLCAPSFGLWDKENNELQQFNIGGIKEEEKIQSGNGRRIKRASIRSF
jgi:hypothetical protein